MADNSIQGYWSVFGGFWGLLRSTYFWLALVVTIISSSLWTKYENGDPIWVEIAIDIAPSLLGFALGGMAIMLSFSSGRFLSAVRQSGKPDSFFMKMMASFVNFSAVLTASLVIALISKSNSFIAMSFVGVFLLIYGVLLVVSTAASVWHTARIFNAAVDMPPES